MCRSRYNNAILVLELIHKILANQEGDFLFSPPKCHPNILCWERGLSLFGGAKKEKRGNLLFCVPDIRFQWERHNKNELNEAEKDPVGHVD